MFSHLRLELTTDSDPVLLPYHVKRQASEFHKTWQECIVISCCSPIELETF
jgi:hypothetical protein